MAATPRTAPRSASSPAPGRGATLLWQPRPAPPSPPARAAGRPAPTRHVTPRGPRGAASSGRARGRRPQGGGRRCDEGQPQTRAGPQLGTGSAAARVPGVAAASPPLRKSRDSCAPPSFVPSPGLRSHLLGFPIASLRPRRLPGTPAARALWGALSPAARHPRETPGLGGGAAGSPPDLQPLSRLRRTWRVPGTGVPAGGPAWGRPGPRATRCSSLSPVQSWVPGAAGESHCHRPRMVNPTPIY